VRGGTDREPELVLDPCLLNPQPTKAKAERAEPYALVYGYGFPAWLKTAARQWSDRTGIRLVSVGYSNEFADDQRIAEGPIEFARLVAGAHAVITNFFHGCVFALVHGKPWATAPSDYRAIKIPDLAAVVGAEDRLVNSQTRESTFAALLETPIRPAVEARIAELCARSEAYLDAALA
jgi:hypothetical protein